VISATSVNLCAATCGGFSEKLYYRLNPVVLDLDAVLRSISVTVAKLSGALLCSRRTFSTSRSSQACSS
jgi:DNA-binding NtrC family response regulator